MAERDDDTGSRLNLLERWNIHREEVSKGEELTTPMGNDESLSFTYLDGPYLKAQDNGALGTNPPDGQHMPWGSHLVSDIFAQPPSNAFYSPFRPTDAGGAYVVGEVHENWIGDQNGNGVLEWVVFFFYFPWQNDGLDNDGDGCVDEYRDQLGVCDLMPDAMVIYETGGFPRVGGSTGSLLVNLDWYSGHQIADAKIVEGSEPK